MQMPTETVETLPRATSQRKAEWAWVTAAAIGSLTSWAIGPVSYPIVVTRLRCALSAPRAMLPKSE
jgi:hypothetical protein